MHVDPVWHIVLAKLHLDVGLVLSEFDDLPVLAAAVGLGRRTHVDRFEDIGFTLRVVSVENIRPRIKIHM